MTKLNIASRSPSVQVNDDSNLADSSQAHEMSLSEVDVLCYTQPFLSFISQNPTTFHAIAHFSSQLESHGFRKLSERQSWTSSSTLEPGGKYFFTRNGTSLVAFVVGSNYKPGNGAAVIASHADVLTARVKPIPTLSTKAGYVQLGVAPYAGGMNTSWWDRDLGIGGRVLVKDDKTGKIETKLVQLAWPIARIPTLAPHFGAEANYANANQETQMVPIIGLDNGDVAVDQESFDQERSDRRHCALGAAGTFVATQPDRLVKAIASELGIQDCEYLNF